MLHNVVEEFLTFLLFQTGENDYKIYVISN